MDEEDKSFASVEVVERYTEEQLLQNLAKHNPAWGDDFLYEAQITKLQEHLGGQDSNWSGKDTENLIRDVVDCSLTLMQMAEIEQEC